MVTAFLPILPEVDGQPVQILLLMAGLVFLPAVLLMLTCVTVGYWNMRKIDRFLAEHPDPADSGQTSPNVDSQVRLPR